MASPTLKFKRGVFSQLPTLAVGEPGFTTDRFQLYVGTKDGNQLIGGGDFWSNNTTTTGGGLKLYEAINNGSNFVQLKSPNSLAADITFTLPGTDASTSGQVLQSDAGGILSFGDVNLTAIDIDGGTDIGADIVDADLFIVDDGATGTNRKTAASRIKSYVLGGSSGATFTEVTVGSAVTITSSGIDAGASGIITASSFVGDLTGNADTATSATSATSADTVKTISNSTDATQYLTFVADDNGSATAEEVRTDAGITFNPNSNLLNVGGNITVSGTVDGRDVLDDGQAGDNLITLTGVARDSTNLGTFTGSTISDNTTIKNALQEVETSLEAISGGGAQASSVAVGQTDTNATHYITFVADNNTNPTQENIRTDAGVAYNPSTNIMTVGEVSVTTLDIGGTNVTATATELNVLDGVTAFLDEDNLGSNSDTAIPSQQSVKAYVDNQIAGVAVTFSLAADTGTNDVFQTGETLTISGTTNEVDTVVSDNTITIGLPNSVTVTTALTTPTVNVGALRANDGTASATITNSTGKFVISKDLEVQSDTVLAGVTTMQGSVDLGDQTSDTLTVTARVASNFIPSTDGVRNLGSLSLAWEEGHINHLDGASLNVTGIATANNFKGDTIETTSNGTFGGSVSIAGNLTVGGTITSVDVEDLRVISPVVELGLEDVGSGVLQPPSYETQYVPGVAMWYNTVGVSSENAQAAAIFAGVRPGGSFRIGFATDVTFGNVGAGDSIGTVNAWADIEAKGLWINDCAGQSVVINCSGSERFLNNITVDGGTFT